MERVLIIGGINIDFICKSKLPLVTADSNVGENHMSYGGVGRNISENLGRLGLDVSLISSVGADDFGSTILKQLSSLNINTEYVIKRNIRTGSYIAVLDDKNDMYVAICDNDAVNSLEVEYFQKNLNYINSFHHVVIDANVADDVLEFLLNNVQGDVYVDATSRAKAIKLRPFLDKISFLKCNHQEASAILNRENATSQELLNGLLDKGIKQIVITSGDKPIFYNKEHTVYTADIVKVDPSLIQSTTGCGDAFMSGIVYGVVKGYTIHACVKLAKHLAAQTLQVIQACNPALSANLND